MNDIWIVGFGNFGRMALDRLEKLYRNRRFVIVDIDADRLINAGGPMRYLEQDDGVSFLLRNMGRGKDPDWIIPALPIHLLARWVIEKMKPDTMERVSIPENAGKNLPNFFMGQNGDVYVSHADFLCPEDCPEPVDACFVTGKKRNRDMYDLIKKMDPANFLPVVVRSHQLAPGVGGYRSEQLFKALHQVAKSNMPILLATACRCHGVITGITFRTPISRNAGIHVDCNPLNKDLL